MAYTVLDAAAARFQGYQAPQFNLLQRNGLDASLRALIDGLTEWPPQRWVQHPDHAAGLAGHWQQIHQILLQNIDAVTQTLRDLADARVSQAQRARVAGQAHEAARHVVAHLHGHHRLEDQQLFPQLLHRRPSLALPMALLEADHIVLNAALAPFEQALAQFPSMDAEPAAFTRLAQTAAQVQRVAHRHIADEEEIVMPAVLGVG